MHYYKKTELAKTYGVNPRTVSRWIEEARKGKLDLELHEEGGKFYISKTPRNQRFISGLTKDRRKYLNKKNLKTLKPSSKLYDIYNEEQLLEIISSIETHREVPLKFAYFDKGAFSWDEYAWQMYESENGNTLTNTVALLDMNREYLDAVLRSYDKVNVVDVGAGNALPTKSLLNHLLKSGKLNRYIAIDISTEMLSIAQKNIQDWFGDNVSFEGYSNDIEFEPFADVTAEPPGGAVNLVLLFGGTLANLRAPEDALRVIRKSMFRNDLFVYCKKLDLPQAREEFSALAESRGRVLLSECEHVLNLLGIDKSLYEVQIGYDPQARERYIRVQFRQAITLEFELSRGCWRVDLNKADALLVLRAGHATAVEVEAQLVNNGFSPLHQSQTPGHEYLLIISDLQKEGVRSRIPETV